MAKAATAFVDFQGDFSQIQAGAKVQSGKLQSTFGSTFKNIAKGAAVAFASAGFAKFVRGAFKEAEQSAKVARQTAAVIKSTGGAAKISAEHVDKFANKLKGVAAVDDEIIASGENVLLTFTKVRNEVGKGNDIFDQASVAALNLSATFGTDLQGSMIQIGKALNDPVKNLGKLQRAGVDYSKTQVKQIKAFAEAGDLLSAQKIILGELTKEFGGAAAAAATPSERLKVAFGDLEESLGKVLVPLVQKFVPVMQFLATHPEAAAAIIALAAAFASMLIVTKIVSAVQAFAEATKIATAVQWLFNAAVSANPVVLAVAALVALGVAVFIAYKKFKPFHDAVDKAWQILQSLFRWVQKNWPLLLAILTGPIGLATLFIIRNFDKIKSAVSGVKNWVQQKFGELLTFFKGLPGKIGKAFSGLVDILTAPYRAAFAAIARLWNNTIGKLHFKIPSWVPGLGGKGFDVPNIPSFHTGGVFAATGGQGLALLKSGEGIFTPAQMKALGAGGGKTVNVDARLVNNGTIFTTEDLHALADERDRKLVAAIGAGAR